MSYQDYRQGSGNQEIAIDWKAKEIPLEAYKHCLDIGTALEVALMGSGDEHPERLVNLFVANLSTFYKTTELERLIFCFVRP